MFYEGCPKVLIANAGILPRCVLPTRRNKASITSVFGRILKFDSTKKIVRKLAGKTAGTLHSGSATNQQGKNGRHLGS